MASGFQSAPALNSRKSFASKVFASGMYDFLDKPPKSPGTIIMVLSNAFPPSLELVKYYIVPLYHTFAFLSIGEGRRKGHRNLEKFCKSVGGFR